MDKALEATGPIQNKGMSNNRKRPISLTDETPTESPQSKKLNRGDKHDSTDSDDGASLTKILQSNEDPDEAIRNYLKELHNEAEVETFFEKFKEALKLAPAQGSASPTTTNTMITEADPEAGPKAEMAEMARRGLQEIDSGLTEFVYFPRLPTKVQVMILKIHLVQESEVICPFYCDGYQPEATVFNPKELFVMSKYPLPAIWHKERPNVNLALLGVNKALRSLALPIFWCNHYFLFNDARSCFWFFKKIGTANMRRVDHAIFNISSGFFLSKEHRSQFDICEERRWCEVFRLLKRNHRLRNCIIRFYDWNDLDDRRNLSYKDKVQMTKGRMDLVAILAGFRGVGRVILENDKCRFLGEEMRFQVAKLMTATKEERPVRSHGMETSIREKWFQHE